MAGIAEQLSEQGRQFNARFDSLTCWLVGMQAAGLLAMGGLLVSILLRLN